MPTAIYDRDSLAVDQPVIGPAIVEEWTSTTLVPPGWTARTEPLGNLLLTRTADRDARPRHDRGDPGRPGGGRARDESHLVRTAHNPLLYEVQDFGLGIVGADGRLWAEAPGIAGFISALSDTVRSGIETHGPDGFLEGDVLIVNDPFLTGPTSPIRRCITRLPRRRADRVRDRHRPLGRHRGEESRRVGARHY